jgi:uncharacterized protein
MVPDDAPSAGCSEASNEGSEVRVVTESDLVPGEPRTRQQSHVDSTERRLVAPLWHTALLIAILLAIAAYGVLAQSRPRSGTQLVEHRGSAVPLYLSLAAAELGLLRFVVAGGLRKTQTRFRELLGERWGSWRGVARDAGLALVVWAGWTIAASLVRGALGHDPAKEIGTLLPRGPFEIGAWLLLSLTAGFCEEAIFRGYLQRQFRAVTGSAAVAVLLQSIVFGVSHAYQGVRNVIAISILGAIYGWLALWRRSLRPGMIAHAWTDIFSGIMARG